MAMKISGLQKVSTIDYPGEIACVLFLHGCNFRCGFCYNPDLVIRDFEGGFGENEILNFLKKRIGKLDGVCITGGEPLISLDFDFVKKIKDLGFKIKIDTNGSFPSRLKEMIDLDLVDYIAMDVKACREDYGNVVGADVDLSKIEESIKIVNDFGNSEFRTTVVGRFHNAKNLKKMGSWMNRVCGRKPGKIFLQGFKPNKNGMVDDSFLEEGEIFEEELVSLKREIEGLFGEVGVRV